MENMTLTDCYVIKYVKRQSLPSIHLSTIQLSLFTVYLKAKTIFKHFFTYRIASRSSKFMLNIVAVVVVNRKKEATRKLTTCWTSADCARPCGHCGTGSVCISEVVLDCNLVYFEFTCFTIFQLLPHQLPSPLSEYFCFCKQLCAVLSRLLCDLLPALLIPFPGTNLLPAIKTELWGCREIKSGQIFWSTLCFSCCWQITVYLSQAFLFHLILNAFKPRALMSSNTFNPSCWITNPGSNNEGVMEAKPMVVNPKLVKELGVFKGLKANVCSQRFNHDLSGTSVTSKRGNIYRKSLSHLKKEYLRTQRELTGQGKGWIWKLGHWATGWMNKGMTQSEVETRLI